MQSAWEGKNVQMRRSKYVSGETRLSLRDQVGVNATSWCGVCKMTV